ncbi:MAG: dUTP diphosphatase [Desulfotalea sp.]
MNCEIKFKWLAEKDKQELSQPSYETQYSAGMDIAAAVEEAVIIKTGEIQLIPTGFALAIPNGYEVQVRPRSGLAVKHGITLINSPGTIDSDYRGEVKVPLINHGKVDFIVKRGDRIAQMVVAQVAHVKLIEVGNLDETERGDGGFGHTGV